MRAPPIADHQGGAFSRAQALAAGFARSTIIRRVRAGDWVSVTPRVFVARGTLVTPLTSAWAGHLTTGGIVSHESAGTLRGFCATPARIHVTVPGRLHVDEDGIVEHRVRFTDSDVEEHHGLPLTTAARTIVDLLATTPLDAAQSLLFRAVQQRWIDDATLLHQIDRRVGMHGTKQLRELVKLLGTGAHSPAERILHEVLTSIHGLSWKANVPLRVGARTAVVDVLVAEHRIVIEVDGRRYHSDSDTFGRDRERQNDLVNDGWTVLRFTWLDLVRRPEYVRRMILDAITLAVPSVAKVVRTEP